MAHFYARVRADTLLGPIFLAAIGTSDAEWDAHLARIGDFWSSVILRSGRYHGDPYTKHARLDGLEPHMFAHWLALFRQSCAELFPAETADLFIDRAERIASSLRIGLFGRVGPHGVTE